MSDNYNASINDDLSRVVSQANRAATAIEGIGKSSQKAGNQASFFGKQMQSALSSSIEQIRGFILAQVGVQAALGAITQAIRDANAAQAEAQRAGRGLAASAGPGDFDSPQAAIDAARAAASVTGMEDDQTAAAMRALVAGFRQGGGRGRLATERANRAIYLAGQASQGGMDPAQFASNYGRLLGMGAQRPEDIIASAVLSGSDPGSIDRAAAMRGGDANAFRYLIAEGQRRMEMERRRQYDATRGQGILGAATPEWLRYANAEILRSGAQRAADDAEAARRAAFDAANQVPERPEVGAVQRIADRVSVAPIQQ